MRQSQKTPQWTQYTASRPCWHLTLPPCHASPQINALKEGGYGWLHEMLECFNSGEAAGHAARHSA